MKLCNRLAWECFSAGMQCSVTGGSEVGGGQAPVFAVWRQCGGMAESWGPVWPWQLRLPTVMHPAGRGQGLSPAVSTPIGFHGSSLICRICHCRGGLLLGGFKPCCHGSQAPSPPYGYFALSLSFCLAVFSNPWPALFLSLSLHLALRCMPSLSFHFCLSAVCLRVRANLRGRVLELGDGGWSQCCGVREGSGREEAFVCLDRCAGPSLNFCQWSKEPMM